MYTFIVNPNARSGLGHKIWSSLEETLKEKNVKYEVFFTKYQHHATNLVADITSSGEERTIVALGGDGTMNEVLNGMSHFDKVRVGLIPTGSGNDFARGLGISGKPQDLMNKYLDMDSYDRIDVGSITVVDSGMERKFAISSGLGLDAIVCKKANASKLKKQLNKIGLGQVTYIVLTVINLFTMETMDVEIEYDGEKKSVSKMIFSAAMNFYAEGGGVPMAPKADVKDGLLSVCCVHGIAKWKTFFLLPFLVMAKHEGIKGFEIINSRYFHLKAKGPMILHTDGEYIADVREILYECLPEKLKLLI